MKGIVWLFSPLLLHASALPGGLLSAVLVSYLLCGWYHNYFSTTSRALMSEQGFTVLCSVYECVALKWPLPEHQQTN